MTKSKSSTIAIVVLSVLLAAALASTIVLAAFNASKTGTTTLTFGNGITLEVTGTGVTQGTTSDTSFSIVKPNLSSFTEATISSITATANQDAFIAYKITPSASGTSPTLQAFSLGEVNSDNAADSQTLTWAINDGSTQIGTLTVVFGTGLSYDAGSQAVYNAAAATSIVMFQSVTIAATSTYTVNDFAGLTINGLAVEVAAVSEAGQGTYQQAIDALDD